MGHHCLNTALLVYLVLGVLAWQGYSAYQARGGGGDGVPCEKQWCGDR